MAAPKKKGKKVKATLRLQIPAGQANPSPPVGPALGQHGIAIMEFVKAFNDATSKMEPGMIIPVEITVYEDRSFDFVLKTPPTSYLIKKAIGVVKGSGEPNKNKVGKLTKKQLEEIAKVKMPDLNCDTLEAAMKIVAGTARSMGVEVENG
ncbi:MAG: 50S ribosomal protein L11 [Candidatus Aminicenantes bacterium]|nr:50S ribosomal protein L11 [Candidatus Aminicenantes bacterium]